MEQQKIREYFDYSDGVLYWKTKTAKCVKVGQPAGTLDKRTGYHRVRVDCKF